ncbi:uncharacterized protein LOC129771209 isoform X2 [Toxorhynchites rutilus septentrionalis]|uniref:uncharacterized protein LOC129771209 isoform X2 n=1 Tax=Toxorhynchites rutilus septentrionalis TaxID=329112 RepID=UPI00247AE5F9|nr:uncharacterized protein LOC129771209 isoform X2 [Toxorhynchites rutilus septentrionalis]
MEIFAKNELLRDVNIYHTVYYPTEVMLYFEKHHIFEIMYDLMILLDRKRPDDISAFIAGNIEKIASKYRKINILVKCPPDLELEKFLKICYRVHRSPVIRVKHPKSRRRLENLQAQLKRFRLENKNLLFIGKDKNAFETVVTKQFNIRGYVEMRGDGQNSTKTILPAVIDLKNSFKLLERTPNHPHVKYIERIAFIGRPGPGKRRQAQLLANRLDLVYVSVKELIDRARSDDNLFKKSLELGLDDNVHTPELIATIVQKRLLEPDCLRFGWAMVDFPNTAEDVENLFSLLIVPQKILHVHTNERLCRRRIVGCKHIERNKEGYQSEAKFKEAVLAAEVFRLL